MADIRDARRASVEVRRISGEVETSVAAAAVTECDFENAGEQLARVLRDAGQGISTRTLADRLFQAITERG